MAIVPITGTADIVFTTEDADLAVLPTGNPGLNSLPEALDSRARVKFRTFSAQLRLNAEPGEPPYDTYQIIQRSQTWPDPTLTNGIPTNWDEPLTDSFSNWGFLQVVIDGIDVTWFRGVMAVIDRWGSSEPFDDDIASIRFPQITSLEALPSWLQGEKPVWIEKWAPDFSSHVNVWEGFVASVDDSTDPDSYGVTVDCYGGLYDLDRYLSRPPLHGAPVADIGHLIADAFRPEENPGQRCGYMPEVTTGILSNKAGTWEPKLTGYVQDLLAQATTDDGNQWTVRKYTGGKPYLTMKDKTTHHWTVRCGAPGVSHSLTRDYTMAPNIFFGEGISDDNCRWRNAVYPNLRPDDAPVFPGAIMNSGNSSAGWLLFERELIRRGYALNGDGVYNSSEVSEIKRFQRNGGISVDGAVGPQTWAVAFEPGADGGSLDGGFFAPLAFMTSVIPYYHGGTGGGHQQTPNPDYNPLVPRREHYINWGAGTTLSDGARSSLDLLTRNYPADWIGDITLNIDPQEGHRFSMKAGQNVWFVGHQGVNRLLHIASVEINFQSGEVRLSVDEAGRDALTLAEVKQRNADNASPTWKRDRLYRNSRQTEDRIATWDCENGSGVIPRHATYRGLWNALRIPASAGGEIIRAEFYLDTPARFSAAVFDRPITAAQLRALGGSPLDEGYWDQFGDEYGLVIAWGGDGQAAGYYPGSESEEGALTGVLVDNASWYYETVNPPWLWCCFWVESPTVNYLRGRLFPGLL